MDAQRLQLIADALTGVDGSAALDRLLDACIDLLPVTGASVAVTRDGQHRGSLAVAGDGIEAVDDLQFSLGEGPCVAADAAPGPVLQPDLARTDGEWPAFTPAAVALGVAAVFAFPLRVGPVHLGVLSLYRSEPGDLSGEHLSDAMTIAGIATHLLLDLEGDLTAGAIPERLADVLDQRAHIHQATGMIAAQLGTDPATALVRLRVFAWSRDLFLGDVARDVVARRLRFDEP